MKWTYCKWVDFHCAQVTGSDFWYACFVLFSWLHLFTVLSTIEDKRHFLWCSLLAGTLHEHMWAWEYNALIWILNKLRHRDWAIASECRCTKLHSRYHRCQHFIRLLNCKNVLHLLMNIIKTATEEKCVNGFENRINRCGLFFFFIRLCNVQWK